MNDIRIKSVEAHLPSELRVQFKGEKCQRAVELGGWIATGGVVLASLWNASVFVNVTPCDHGAAVSWDDGEGDLAIDAFHLKQISEEQEPFRNEDLRSWQERAKISNSEAADFLGVSQSTFSTYRDDANIPRAVGIAIRASERDPLLLQAHLRPRRAGRPRKAT